MDLEGDEHEAVRTTRVVACSVHPAACRCRVRGRRKLDRARELLLLLAALSKLKLEGDEL